jgi:hypothetical protein
MFVDRWPFTSRYQGGALNYFVGNRKIFRVVEMELVLMYDIIYTKARVIHSIYGTLIRVVLLVSFIATLVLFPFVNFKDGYNRVDVAISYILLVGAVLLEMASLFITIVSTWTCHYMYMHRYNRLVSIILFFRRLVKADKIWRSGWRTIGQFDILAYRLGHKSSPTHNRRIPSIKLPPPVQVSANLEDLILNELLKIAERCNWQEERMYSLNKASELLVYDSGFDKRIMVWHAATSIILSTIKDRTEANSWRQLRHCRIT